jgi:hypothetical protein
LPQRSQGLTKKVAPNGAAYFPFSLLRQFDVKDAAEELGPREQRPAKKI